MLFEHSENQEQIKLENSRRQETIRIGAEISGIETKRQTKIFLKSTK